jgi:hypothetical protein
MAETDRAIVRNPNTDYEASDWPLLPVGLTLGGVLLVLVGAIFVLKWAYPDAVSDVSRRLEVEPPAPRLQIDPAADLAKFRAEEEQRLQGTYWIDKPKGIVHIPIEQAMRKLARDGIPGFPKAPP